MRSADLRRSRMRLRVAQGLVLVVFGALVARAAHLSLFHRRAAERAAAQMLSVLQLPPERGGVTDRGGTELALTVEAPSVYAIPHAIADREHTARKLAAALGFERQRIAEKLRSRLPFVYVARWVKPGVADSVRALELPGVGIVGEPRRSYPYEGLAASLIGFANIDGAGVRGIEQLEDAWLRGTRRRVPVERDAVGRLLVGPGLDPSQDVGGDVALALDIAFQADAEQALDEAVAASRARGGFVVAMDPRGGDVLALAERPTFDPNHFRSVPYTETRSRVFLDALEPGSTLKLFLVAAALEAGAVTPRDVIDLEGGSLVVPGKRIRDLHERDSLDVTGVLRVSSNVGAVKIAQRLGPRNHFEMLQRFGFGSVTRCGFPEESAGLLRPWRSWKPVDHATIAFGQGIGVTPMQLAAAIAALANEGVWQAPRLVAARRRPGGGWVQAGRDSDASHRVVSRETAATTLAMLETVVSREGTGRRAALAGVRVAGKTGTAQKLDPESGRYANDRYVAWFAGIIPADDPKLVIVVGLDEPKGRVHTGGGVAAPLFARVAAGHLTRLGIPTRPAPLSPPVPEPAVRTAAAPKPRPAPEPPAARRAPQAAKPVSPVSAAPAEPIVRVGQRTLLPDFRGLSIAEVRRLAAGTPLVLELRGTGLAVEQDPEPGTVLVGQTQSVRVRFATPRHGRAKEREG